MASRLLQPAVVLGCEQRCWGWLPLWRGRMASAQVHVQAAPLYLRCMAPCLVPAGVHPPPPLGLKLALQLTLPLSRLLLPHL